jgi:tetratricopeptide (TPR) repeat protein
MAYYLKDIELQSHAYAMIGELYKSMYQYTEAIQYPERCLKIATKEYENGSKATAYCNLRTVHQLLLGGLPAVAGQVGKRASFLFYFSNLVANLQLCPSCVLRS